MGGMIAGMARRGKWLLAIVFFAGTLQAKAPVMEGQELGLEGYPKGRRPDVIFLAPRLTEPVAKYAVAIETIASQGMTLANAELTLDGVQKEGIIPVLKAAEYTVLQVKDVPWVDACKRLDDLLKVRRTMADADSPKKHSLCAVISEEVTPEELVQTLELLMKTDALILFLPEPKTPQTPVVVYWNNLVCPGVVDVQQIRNAHWLPTFSEIVGLPNPAAIPEPTILPLLTSVGYQLPLESTTIHLPIPKHRDVYTTVWYYTEMPEHLPWIPDYTCDEYKPERRHFVRGTLPLTYDAVKTINFRPLQEDPQGLYLRTRQTTLEVLLPKDISCVIRVKGKTVLDRWEPTEEFLWKMSYSTPVPVDFFFLIPPAYDPKSLPLFVKAEEPVTEATASPSPTL